MRILLIDPPYTIFTGYDTRYFPVGLGYIGAVLKAEGYEVMIYEADRFKEAAGNIDFSNEYIKLDLYIKAINDDGHFVWRQLTKVVVDYKPDIIGITAVTMKFASVVKTAKVCKGARPDCKIIVGGPHATDWPDICFKSPYIDYCISGEGEEAILLLLEAVKNKLVDNIGAQGVSYRKDGAVVFSKEPALVSSLDRYPFPARELLANRRNYTSEDMGVIVTSRGCPYKCGFCSHSPDVRYRDLNNIITEIKNVIDDYGTRQFAIKDDSFTVDRERTVEFCNLLKKEKLNINWDCTTRVNLIDEKLLEVMQGSGCNTIKLGIESGSARILKEINKGITIGQIKKTAQMLNRRGIFWSAYFMYGLPTETKEDILQTLEFMKELNPNYAGLGLYAPMPNTRLWEQGISLGGINPYVEIEHFLKTNPKDYFFKDADSRTLNIEYDEFFRLSRLLMRGFNKHNVSWLNMLRRGWARRLTYQKDKRLLFRDIIKAISQKLRPKFNFELKRVFDTCFSLSCFISSLPLCVLISIFIYLEDAGPIFFSDYRVGRDRRLYLHFKFRSMSKAAEEDTGPMLAKEKDERVTKIGRILRATALDELPQLWNILKGDMSFVGPRPERPFFVEKFIKEIPGYEKRFAIKPGLTGLAQVYDKYDTPAKKKLEYDLKYIEEMNIFLDLKLIFLSFLISFKGGWQRFER